MLPDSPVSGVQSMEEVVHDSTGSYRFPMLLLSAFSLLALVLAAVGIVGVVGNSVAQRTNEIRDSYGSGRRAAGCAAADGEQQHGVGDGGPGGPRIGSAGLTRFRWRGCSMACSRSIPRCWAPSRCCWRRWRLARVICPRGARRRSIPLLRCAASKASQYLLFWVIFHPPNLRSMSRHSGIRIAYAAAK